MDKLTNNRKKVVSTFLKRVRDTFYSTTQELRAELSQGLTSEEMPQFREAFSRLVQEVEPEIKTLAFYKNDNVVLASKKDTTTADLLAIAVKSYNEGLKEESYGVFALAAMNTQNLQIESMPSSALVQNACSACGSDLPLTANYCPMCGMSLNANQIAPSPVITDPVEVTVVTQLPSDVQKLVDQLVAIGNNKAAARLIQASLKK